MGLKLQFEFVSLGEDITEYLESQKEYLKLGTNDWKIETLK